MNMTHHQERHCMGSTLRLPALAQQVIEYIAAEAFHLKLSRVIAWEAFNKLQIWSQGYKACL